MAKNDIVVMKKSLLVLALSIVALCACNQKQETATVEATYKDSKEDVVKKAFIDACVKDIQFIGVVYAPILEIAMVDSDIDCSLDNIVKLLPTTNNSDIIQIANDYLDQIRNAEKLGDSIYVVKFSDDSEKYFSYSNGMVEIMSEWELGFSLMTDSVRNEYIKVLESNLNK